MQRTKFFWIVISIIFSFAAAETLIAQGWGYGPGRHGGPGMMGGNGTRGGGPGMANTADYVCGGTNMFEVHIMALADLSDKSTDEIKELLKTRGFYQIHQDLEIDQKVFQEKLDSMVDDERITSDERGTWSEHWEWMAANNMGPGNMRGYGGMGPGRMGYHMGWGVGPCSTAAN